MLKDPFDKGLATGIVAPASVLTRAGHRDVAVLQGPPQSLGPLVASRA